MKKAVIFAEVFSQNVGDGVIYESLKYLFNLNSVETRAIDISGRSGWGNRPNEGTVGKKSIFRRLASKLARRSRFSRRLYNALLWFFVKKSQVRSVWEEAILSSDVVVIGGGQLLTDLDFSFPPRVFEIARLAKRHNKPLVLLGVGASGWGPIAKILYRRALKSSVYISCRDYVSSQGIQKYLPNLEIHVHPDPAFIYNRINKKTLVKYERPIEYIGFNFQNVEHFKSFVPELKDLSDDEYVSFWSSLISSAKAQGYIPVIFTNGDVVDYEYAEAVHRKLLVEGCDVVLEPRPVRPHELVEFLVKMDAVVSTRMHAGIVAFALEKVVLAISWDRKVDNVWDSLGMKDNVISSSIFRTENPWNWVEQRLTPRDAATNQKLNNICDLLTSEVAHCCLKLRLRDKF